MSIQPEPSGESSQLDEAIRSLEGCQGSASELAELYNRRGCIRYRAGQLAAACADFDRALGLRTDFAEAYNNRACARAEGGDQARAQIDLSRALALRADLGQARENLRLVARTRTGPSSAQTTVSSVEASSGASFAEGLVGFLEAEVQARPGFEDCRQDAISEIVTRVLQHSQDRDVSLGDALRELRRSSTRGWVRDLMQRFGRRGGELEGAVAAKAPAPPPAEPTPTLRLGALFEAVEARLLAASRPSKRRRRKVVWGIYLSSLLEGVHLSRAEVIAAARALGLGLKRVTDRQLERDLELLVRELRASDPRAKAT